MIAEPVRERGRLKVSFKSSSHFLGQTLPVEIRDAEGRLVARSTGPVDLPLAIGLYVVEATLPGGSRHTEVVQVAAGPPTEVVLRARKSRPSDDDNDAEPDSGDEMAVAGAGAVPQDLPAIDLVDQVDCALLDGSGARWVFDAVAKPGQAPMATFRAGRTTIGVSIPVNPSVKAEERPCTVTFAMRAGRVRADVAFAHQRRVAWTLGGLVKSDAAVSTAELFANADQILLEKYRDPSAAALGGLTLHRLGRLRERSAWVENLARDFGWIPDGGVLLAALLAHDDDPRQRARGLDRLIQTAELRPLFADGRALAIKLLRSWPDDDRSDVRAKAMGAIAAEPGTVDWDAMAFTTYDEG